MAEQWHALVWPHGWPEPDDAASYAVTRDGRIRVWRNGRSHELAQHPDRDGYLCVLVRLETGKRRKLRVHRAVCEAFNGRKPACRETRHLDGDKRNNHADNLRWGTQRENAADRMRHGRGAVGLRNGAYTKPHTRRRGVTNGNAKLMPEQVLAILSDARSQSRIAEDYGVNQTLVSAIKLGRIWNHVTGLPRRRVNRSLAEAEQHYSKGTQ